MPKSLSLPIRRKAAVLAVPILRSDTGGMMLRCGSCGNQFYQGVGRPARLCPSCRPVDRYDAEHRAARDRMLADYVPGVSRCARGGEVLTERNLRLLHADHRDEGTGYEGLSCQHHNTSRRPVADEWTTTRSW